MICAHAVSVSFKKVPGVESVEVSLNQGKALVKLKPGNNVRLETFWEIVRKNGFTPKQTRVTARGRVLAGDPPRFEVSGAGAAYTLTDLKQPARGPVIVEGTVAPEKRAAATLRVIAIREEK